MLSRFRQGVLASPHTVPLLVLLALNLLFWIRVLATNQVLLPGDFLRGFAPFGSDSQAPWNILQWDALGQYYPWRSFAAQQLRSGLIPLWNPYQFAGTPFVANGQSAVFYPLNLPFWLFDVARAFGISAFLHTLLSGIATYFLAQQWGRSRAASLLAAVAWCFCGYLSAWAMLPTLSNTAAWLPLLILLLELVLLELVSLERVVHLEEAQARDVKSRFNFHSVALALFVLALCCTVLAGHAQIFLYCLMALLLRALTLPQHWRALRVLLGAGTWAFLLGALQLLPTLELSRQSHRAGQTATAAGWQAIAERSLQPGEWMSLFLPDWPTAWGSLNENFGYVGIAAALLALCSFLLLRTAHQRREWASPLLFAWLLTIFGLAYAMATLSRAFYFLVPGMAQFAGVGRALVLWSFGVALLAAFGLDALRAHWKASLVAPLAVAIVTCELFAANWNTQPTAPRETIYPVTPVTQFLQQNTRDGSRVVFITPRSTWAPVEGLQSLQRNHPRGVLPPNGAMVYNLRDISGYDSLALRAYREAVAPGEEYSQNDPTLSPQWNGNMVLLNNPRSGLLDALRVRYIVSEEEQPSAVGREVLRNNTCIIYERRVLDVPRIEGSQFAQGWRNERYQPESYRFGSFLSLCALAALFCMLGACRLNRRRSNP
jgi:hypothetical protein